MRLFKPKKTMITLPLNNLKKTGNSDSLQSGKQNRSQDHTGK